LAEQELERSQRYARPVCMLMLDVDHFKKINDTYGHQVGDEALRAVADTCQLALRNCDAIGRMGGEEFAMMLPETELDQAELVAERIRSAIAELSLDTPKGTPLTLTASIGITQVLPDEINVDSALARADSGLYLAKQTGRNRVTVS
jgi:diguanylate cyclase (GGDEF)-like protein